MRDFRGFAFMSAKGGVGKTTLLTAFARRLSGRVALLDLDFSNPVLNIALGLDHYRVQELKGGRFLPLAWEEGELMSLAFFTAPGGILRQPNSDYRMAFIRDLLRPASPGGPTTGSWWTSPPASPRRTRPF